MVDRRVGTLPAPLSTIVYVVHLPSLIVNNNLIIYFGRFHYDEENGGQPCEAAFLSELKDKSGQGVKEVVVLVS
jgi:hypothetical protein